MLKRHGRRTWTGLVLAGALVWIGSARADVAATGTFGINVHLSFPTGTFDGAITGFDTGPFDVGGNPVDLATDVGSMTIPTGNLTQIDIGALAVTFDFAATDDNLTVNDLDFTGAGVAVCDDAITCSQGQGTFVADVTSLTDPGGLLPGGFVYTFDGTVVVDPGPFDAAGVFGLNAFPVTAVPAGVPVMATSDPTTFFDSRQNTLRDFLVDLTFAEVTNPGTVSFLGKSAVPGMLPASIGVDPDLSVVVDIVTGGGLAFTPPVDVCVHYDDVDMDGVVDGTSVAVDTLRLLHAAALGDDFQDVTTTVGGGTVCGQVGSLSPFVVAIGPPPTTTTSTTTSTSTTTIETTTTSTSTSTSTTTTTLPARLSGKKLLLKDNAAKPRKRKVQLVSKDAVDQGAGPGSVDDPTLAPSSLRLVGNLGSSVGGAFDETYDLPMANWKYLKKKAPEKGYKFSKGNPIKSLVLKTGKLLKIKGKGDLLDIDLAVEPSAVQAELRLGGRTYCFTFGGDTTFKEGKKFLAKNAGQAAACPGAGGGSPSGAFVD
jgi:hypothetical protein